MNVYNYDAIVVGTGAAGYNAACRIRQLGSRSVAIVTEAVEWGTSRNTGSDKQTYYKLGLGGDAPDSVQKMAENLFAGGSVDGDNALCEAALSVRCFMNLCELGVPFPVNRYGEYVGYKTDHDPYARATSVGPLTSKYMTQILQKHAEELEIQVYDGILAIEILKYDGKVCGLLGLERNSEEMVAFCCGDIVLATGGPAGIYLDSVYPDCHTGTTSLALLAGAKAQNLTEWQYGLASVNPRWNVSGTYMQVLPRFVSVDEGGEEREFLADYFEDPYEALSMVFLKGYQWPFDSKKVLDGSSVIDLLVYRECVLKKQKVYLDYTRNPFGLEQLEYERLSVECKEYLKKADACFGSPIERLLKMNAPAVELYWNKGLDITREYLEIALCAQHNNGGIAVDLWWQTSVKGLFAVGECAGTHGVTRPGGSALNAGQVGGLRAAQYISQHGNGLVDTKVFQKVLENSVKKQEDFRKKVIQIATNERTTSDFPVNTEDNQKNGSLELEEKIKERIVTAQRRMSDNASAIRKKENVEQLLKVCREELEAMSVRPKISASQHSCSEDSTAQNMFSAKEELHLKSGIWLYYKWKDTLVTQIAVLTAVLDYMKTVGGTRGSSLCYDKDGQLRSGLDEMFRFTPENGDSRKMVQEIMLTKDGWQTFWRPVRPIPEREDFFENVWRRYRVNKNID